MSLPEGTSPSEFWKRYEAGVVLTEKVVLDPFLGGGTTLVETRRLGARVIGVGGPPSGGGVPRDPARL
ncbi:MAG: hypothetical protein EON92_00945 [Burkholderiales bacterium]|nr:MAG: hypothetical protein EON92_00945 [Burkholderiales bacterium]